jgi:hypothetical protein
MLAFIGLESPMHWAILLMAGAAIIFWIWSLIDCVRHEPSQGNDKLVWVLIIVLLHWLGALLYFVVRRPQRIKEHGR